MKIDEHRFKNFTQTGFVVWFFLTTRPFTGTAILANSDVLINFRNINLIGRRSFATFLPLLSFTEVLIILRLEAICGAKRRFFTSRVNVIQRCMETFCLLCFLEKLITHYNL